MAHGAGYGVVSQLRSDVLVSHGGNQTSRHSGPVGGHCPVVWSSEMMFVSNDITTIETYQLPATNMEGLKFPLTAR